MMAFELAIIGVVVGIVLGLRYKVLALVPAVLFATILAILIGVVRADSFGSIVLTTVALVTSVQVGYLAGIVIHAVITAIFPPRKGGRNSGHGHNSDAEISYIWEQMWQLDGWAEWGSIVNLHPLRPPQA
jgi:general stress protein CsbA